MSNMDISEAELIKQRIKEVQERIERAALAAGRDPRKIELVAVTKEKSAAVVKILAENGIRKIGESYLKEALFKIRILQDFPIEWHMVGIVQRGKARQVVDHFSLVHSVDNLNLARELDKRANQVQKELPVFVECNVSGEETKQGWNVWDEKYWNDFLQDIKEVKTLKAIKVKGLMTMAPYSNDPEDARPFFIKLRLLRDYLNRELPEIPISGLSMGMSGDFETAIQEGATVLRIGSALVGPR
jgi:pyridoxal phosphate enzyme (YggS family)